MIIPVVKEAEWHEVLEKAELWDASRLSMLVIAPHPDDETLGAGGLIATLRQRGVPVNIAAITDGENAYENDVSLGLLRSKEQTKALQRLGVDRTVISRFHFPDSGISSYEDELVELLAPLVTEDMHVLAPWIGDFHPDHEACGRAAQRISNRTGAQLTYYLFWTWHRGTAALLEGLKLVRFPLNQEARTAKASALQCHRSQLHRQSGDPILTEELLGPVWRPYEVFITT